MDRGGDAGRRRGALPPGSSADRGLAPAAAARTGGASRTQALCRPCRRNGRLPVFRRRSRIGGGDLGGGGAGGARGAVSGSPCNRICASGRGRRLPRHELCHRLCAGPAGHGIPAGVCAADPGPVEVCVPDALHTRWAATGGSHPRRRGVHSSGGGDARGGHAGGGGAGL